MCPAWSHHVSTCRRAKSLSSRPPFKWFLLSSVSSGRGSVTSRLHKQYQTPVDVSYDQRTTFRCQLHLALIHEGPEPSFRLVSSTCSLDGILKQGHVGDKHVRRVESTMIQSSISHHYELTGTSTYRFFFFNIKFKL